MKLEFHVPDFITTALSSFTGRILPDPCGLASAAFHILGNKKLLLFSPLGMRSSAGSLRYCLLLLHYNFSDLDVLLYSIQESLSPVVFQEEGALLSRHLFLTVPVGAD